MISPQPWGRLKRPQGCVRFTFYIACFACVSGVRFLSFFRLFYRVFTFRFVPFRFAACPIDKRKPVARYRWLVGFASLGRAKLHGR